MSGHHPLSRPETSAAQAKPNERRQLAPRRRTRRARSLRTRFPNLRGLHTTITQNLRSSRKSGVDLECSNTGIDSRQGAKYAKFRNRKIDNFYKPSYSFFPTFAALASLREILRVSVAALPRWALRGERICYINSRTNDRAASGATPSGRRANGPPSSRIGSS